MQNGYVNGQETAVHVFAVGKKIEQGMQGTIRQINGKRKTEKTRPDCHSKYS
jgi:hypothetical protein